jgi:uncharacterized membrane protein
MPPTDLLASEPYSLAQIGLVVLTAAAVFGLLDFAWLSYLGRDLYLSTLGPIMAPSPRYGAVILFYAVYIAGLVYFAVLPAVPVGAGRAAVLGGLLGGFAYAVYDLTNLSTLTAFTWKLAIIDIGWGALASAAAAASAAAVARAV